ncbi:MAG: hypothetical protein AAF494_04310 [Pseudomonadota bacterium]
MASLARSAHGSSQHRLGLALSRELAADETVIWQGMQLARIEPKLFAIYLFAIPWTAFALFWTAMAVAGVSTMQQDVGGGLLAWAFPLFGTPFIAVGCGMLSVPFLPLWERGKVLYAVTNRRVLKVRLGRDLTVKSVPARRIGLIERNEDRLGRGQLKLAVAIGRDSDGDPTTEHFQLGMVADVMAADQAITQLKQKVAV